MDPLKPFGTLLRTAWLKKLRRTDKSERSENTAFANNAERMIATAESPAVNPVQARLRTRIASLGSWNTAQARELFVETILLSELGADLERDPEFAALVKNVGQQLATNPALSRRLDVLLKELAQPAAER
jgi:hypothetical protein